MIAISKTVVVPQAVVAAELWGRKKAPRIGWRAELQGLVEAGRGKALKVGPLSEKAQRNRSAQIRKIAKASGLAVEFASQDDCLFVRLAGQPAKPELPADDAPAHPKQLPEFLFWVLSQFKHFRTAEVILNLARQADGAAMRAVSGAQVKSALNDLVQSGRVLRRDEEGVPSYKVARDVKAA